MNGNGGSETNWEALHAAAPSVPKGVHDILTDDAIQVVYDIIKYGLGLDPMWEGIEDARNEIQAYVQLALAGVGRYSDGSPIRGLGGLEGAIKRAAAILAPELKYGVIGQDELLDAVALEMNRIKRERESDGS